MSRDYLRNYAQFADLIRIVAAKGIDPAFRALPRRDARRTSLISIVPSFELVDVLGRIYYRDLRVDAQQCPRRTIPALLLSSRSDLRNAYPLTLRGSRDSIRAGPHWPDEQPAQVLETPARA
jgi:hypothetical protein